MKFNIAALATLAMSASLVAAHNCHSGLKYCAYTLTGRGDYHTEILEAIDKYGVDPATVNPDYFLYQCTKSHGVVVLNTCPRGCTNGGDSKSDYCS